MFFNVKTLFVGALTLLSAVYVNADACDEGPWAPVSAVGGQGGDRFCTTDQANGVVITGVQVWATSKSIRGVQFYYSNGKDSGLIGDSTHDEGLDTRLDWDASTDVVDQVKMWGNGDGTWLGRFYLHTKSGKQIDIGKDTNGQDTFETNVGAGVLLGAFGAAKEDGDKGKRIVAMGLLFLKSKITKISQDEVVFDETPEVLNARKEGLATKTVDYADHTNSLPDAIETFTFGKMIKQATSKTYSNANTNAFGVSIASELSGEFLGIGGKTTYGLSYDYTHTSTEETSQTDEVTLNYLVVTPLKPGERVFCRATAMKGTYSGGYSCKVNIWLEDGTKYSFGSRGTMNQIQWSEASSSCQDHDFDPIEKRDTIVHTRRATKFIA